MAIMPRGGSRKLPAAGAKFESQYLRLTHKFQRSVNHYPNQAPGLQVVRLSSDGLTIGLGNPAKLREMQRMLHIGRLRHRTCVGEPGKIAGDGAQDGPACARDA